MANIKTHLNDIKGALFGKDVRGSIHDGMDAINKEIENTTGRQVDLENTFDQLVINAGNSNAEIVDARVKSDGTSYSKLGDRLNEVDSQLEHIENNPNDIVLYSFFENNSTPTNTNFYISNDGINLNKINNNYVLDARDPSIVYENGYWLVACTSYNPHDFRVYRSKDFVNWEKIDINCNMCNETNKIWAPEWFKDDNGDLYIIISKQYGESNDIDNKLISSFRPYIIKCEDIENLRFGAPRQINLEDSNKIDGHIIKHNGIYNLFIKDEYDKYIEHWTSTNLSSWVKAKDKVLEFGQYVEGTCIVKYNNKFYAYNDSFKDDFGYMYCSVSDDLYNWSERKLVNSSGERLRHGYALNVSDNKAKSMLSKFMNFNINSSNKIMRNKIIDLSKYVNENSEIHDLELIDRAVYRIRNNEEYIIKSVNNKNKISEFYIIISTDSVGSLTFDTDKSIIDLPNGYSYSAQYSDNDVLIKFVYSEYFGRFKPTTVSNSFLVAKNSLQKDCSKQVNITTGTYELLNVEAGAVYTVSGGNDVIINNVTSLSDGAKIYFMLNSGSTGSITIKSGSNISVPGGTFVISKENNNNDCLIEFIKVNKSTFRLRK